MTNNQISFHNPSELFDPTLYGFVVLQKHLQMVK